jgi:hypothetical protein
MAPSLENIQTTQKIYRKVLGWDKIDNLLYGTFKYYPENIDPDIVLFKIELLDGLYKCNLKLDKTKVTDEIISLNLDLPNGETVQNVKKIAEIKLKDTNRYVGNVFSSKYCHFHVPEKYPIIDSFARMALRDLYDYSWKYYQDYGNVKKVIDNLIAEIDENLTYKEISIYLYLLSQWRNHQNQKGSVSVNIKRAICENKKLFEKIDPFY